MPHPPVRNASLALLLALFTFVLAPHTLVAQQSTNCPPPQIICDGDPDEPPPPPPARAGPVVVLDPHHPGFRDITQGSATVGYTSPAYVSRDEERSISLLFSSGQARPRGFIQVDASNAGTEVPNRMSMRLRDLNGAWMTFTSGSQEHFYSYTGQGPIRLAAQFDATHLGSAAYSYDVVVRSWWPDGAFQETVTRTRIPIINERSNPVGLGWSIVGLQRIVNQGDGVFIVQGDGSAVWHARPCSSCAYTRPAGDFSTVTWNGNGWTRRYPDGAIAVFASNGLLSYVEDRFGSGNRTSYGYDGSGRLTNVTDPAGRQIGLGYTGSGALSWITDPSGRSVSTAAVGSTLFYIAEPDGLPGLDMHFSGDHLEGYWGRAQSRGNGDTNRWHYTYDAWDRVASLMAPAVSVQGAVMRPIGQFVSLERAVLPVAGTGTAGTPAPLLASGEVRTQMTTPLGHTTRVRVDRFGLPLRIEEPLSRTTVFHRNAHGQVTTYQSALGGTTTYTWAGVQLLSSQNNATQQSITYGYENTYNQLVTASGHTLPVWNTYSADNKLLVSTRTGTNSAAFETTYAYDALGRVTQITEPSATPSVQGRKTIVSYAVTPWQNTSTVQVGVQNYRTTAYRYDTLGRVRAMINPQGDSARTEYDVLNRVTKSVDELGAETILSYGRTELQSVQDPVGQVYSFVTNALGWVEQETDPLGRSLHYTYDAAGNLGSSQNRRNQLITFQYDALSRPTSRTQHAENVTTSWEYDPQHRWVRTIHPTGTDEVHVDPAGRPVQELSRGQSITSSYDSYDRRTQVSLGGSWQRSLGYRYNQHMQLDSLIDFTGQVTTIGYDARGLRTGVTLPQGMATAYTYSSVHRASRIQLTSDLALDRAMGTAYSHDFRSFVGKRYIAQFDTMRVFTYDAAGRLTQFTDQVAIPGTPGNCESHIIDPDTGEVCDPSRPGSYQTFRSVNYSYDAAGNRTDGNAVVGSGNRTQSFEGYALTYDFDGNLTSKSNGTFAQTFTWNSMGQLTQVNTNGNIVSYQYGGRDHLVMRNENGAIYRYYYDGDNLLLETIDGWGEPHRLYAMYPGVDRAHSLHQWTPWEGASTHYYAVDELGSVTGLIGPGQQVSGRYRYDPWGQLEHYEQQAHNTLHLAGRYRDWTSGLYYNRNRWYDSHTGRFISEDPIRLAGGLNLYAYAGNNPVNATDPFGLCPETQIVEGFKCHELDGETVTAKRGGGGNANPTANFGNPCARGGTCTAGTSGGGSRRGGGTTAKSTAQCLSGLFLTTGGTASSLKEAQHIRGRGNNLQWRGANNKWNSATWPGNQWTGGRNAVVAAGRGAQVAGRAFGGAGIVISGGQAAHSLYNGDYLGAGFHTLDAVMSGVGTFGGPVGLGANLLYFGASHYSGC